MMNRLKYVVCTACLMGCLWSCSDDEEVTFPVPQAEGTMQDLDGNSYRWVRIDTLDWMAENLKSGTRWYRQSRQRFAPGDTTECARKFDIFGNYYLYSEALAQCPDGWRLPTDDDWKCLERACGMSWADADRTGWRGEIRSALTDAAGIGLRYGGELAAWSTASVSLYHDYDYAVYWSATIDESSIQRSAFIRKLTPGQDGVQRVAAPVASRWYSVRFVRRSPTQ